LSSSGDKKRNKGDKQDLFHLKGEQSERRNYDGEKVEVNTVIVDTEGETDDEGLEGGQGDMSGQSTSETETAGTKRTDISLYREKDVE
jgi:hypothetical protein